MRHIFKVCLFCLFYLMVPAMVPARALDIDLIATGAISGTAFDNSGLSGTLEDGLTPHNRMGGFGSAIAYSGFGNRFVAAPDRGPADGTTHYIDRYYELDFFLSGSSVVPTLVSTHLLSNGTGSFYTGSAAAFDASNSTNSLRFDPEGIRVASNKNLYVSDEYGPFVYEFNPQGERVRALDVPDRFLITHPNATGSNELPPGNTSGRQSNRGMEGLAISPDGTKLYGIMQNALIQDNALNSSNSRRGLNNRILEIDIATGQTREFVYVLDNRSYGVNEIVAVNDHEFLVIERDGNAGAGAVFKSIYLIDISGATDVSAIASLPQTTLPPGVTAVAKTLLINLLDPKFSLAGLNFPEKIEGLTFGPDLPDGRHLLYVLNDNDFNPDNPTNIWAFALGKSVLPDFQAQVFVPEPSTLLLMAGGLTGFGLRRRRRS